MLGRQSTVSDMIRIKKSYLKPKKGLMNYIKKKV